MLFVSLHLFSYVFLAFSAHANVQLCLSLYAALFDTLCILAIAFGFQQTTRHYQLQGLRTARDHGHGGA
jgi:hypothetical protein